MPRSKNLEKHKENKCFLSSQDDPKTGQDAPKTSPKLPKTTSRQPKTAQHTPRHAQDGPRRAQATQNAQRLLKIPPRCPQDGFKMPTRWPQDGLKMASRWLQDDPQDGIRLGVDFRGGQGAKNLIKPTKNHQKINPPTPLQGSIPSPFPLPNPPPCTI